MSAGGLLLTRQLFIYMSPALFIIMIMISLLLRRFVFRMAEASAKRVTRLVMNRKGPWEGYRRVVFFPPSFARTFSWKERRLGTRQDHDHSTSKSMFSSFVPIPHFPWKKMVTPKKKFIFSTTFCPAGATFFCTLEIMTSSQPDLPRVQNWEEKNLSQ